MTDTEPVFTFVDDVPEEGNPISPSPDLTCRVCGTGLIYSGRGARPKYCDEHKRRSGVAREGSRTARGGTVVVSRAITELTMMYSLAGAGVRFLDPIAGGLIGDNSEKLAESWRLLLETNAKIRKLFLEVEGGAAWLPIVVVHADLIGSIWLAHGLAKAAANEEKAMAAQEHVNV
jgi:hypothetical protein